jgi:hypothetical protein
LLKGEFKEWSSILRGQLPAEFPLKYPLGAISEQLLLADRPRWSEQEAAMPVAPVKPKDKEEPGKQPAGAPPRPRIE